MSSIINNIFLQVSPFPYSCRPTITRRNFAVVAFMPKLLLAYKILLLVIEVIFLVVGHQPSGEFFALDNLHNILSFPVGLAAIYAYTMFNFIMNDCLAGNTKRFLGIILLLEFILFDCLRLFFIFLTGATWIFCILCSNIVIPRHRDADLCTPLP